MTKILIVTDAWLPQVNGVVRTLEITERELAGIGVAVEFVTPGEFTTLPCPTYPEIRLSLATPARIRRRIKDSGADFFHLATEGPLGLLARRAILKDGGHYTTSYHTRFPEYLSARLPVPQSWSYRWLRGFHNAGSGCMVATRSLEEDLRARGFENLTRWSRGVDHELFRPHEDVPEALRDLPRPIFLHVGRVAVEKNIKAFLSLDLPGSKVVVGGGPQLDALRRAYPDVHFTGPKFGEDLAAHYAAGDVFVFPSLTDTFGNVVLEALASGVPVAAFPVTGPLDILEGTGAGTLNHDLRKAALDALEVDRARCREVALGYTWAKAAQQFLDNVLEANGVAMRRAAE
ncbi:glycosyltransferase involved in cell wall biosynthesis [Breoghania corrubedonensis]|uniref:Glycosyltransferase involved in cell wall biosynthesis n=1 Tax=Breoghania corrubedonensis TaxID=665038 RepID=A0A2T5V4S0_9HYPH|nr:glycosyltransferase family 1 protein [Breoghania corrubedonensis]PTW58720.1 glycosyltransferase involved in cell wall biosynthesis [Breoghania corrubedonensis]